ncbi:hypothetical protein LB523_11825 [Mesorhizobium sp. ESP-6-4]|uniref:hypothetical protein n=1 Tax=Mesorhizobium sp. ESP-6-4 TaxID=2876624 RepID=UPI001CCE3466|nr:hypothetical protein [Mesorhizobium sp. ESP-6-4]MBZ9659733.1 hypothetical protein [Mesorhizobium sp. ESP-6-4]
MSIELVKHSLPGWKKSFATMDGAVAELRRHICESCLLGNQGFGDEEGFEFPPIDVVHDGKRYECRDALTLLGTSCGCEYGLEGDAPWLGEVEDERR